MKTFFDLVPVKSEWFTGNINIIEKAKAELEDALSNALYRMRCIDTTLPSDTFKVQYLRLLAEIEVIDFMAYYVLGRVEHRNILCSSLLTKPLSKSLFFQAVAKAQALIVKQPIDDMSQAMLDSARLYFLNKIAPVNQEEQYKQQTI